ncbi:MAG TPA: FkbM family methyltransferase [Flavitalea sp.]|nr:FkbM family methyltransferase [Flavitalea sp.]
MKKIVFDLGAHKGEDSDFYLRKGFRVIAVEASEKLYASILDKFRDHPKSADFTIVNYAITEQDDQLITFYENTEKSVWGTVFDTWNARNTKLHSSSTKTTVKTIRLDTLIKQQLGPTDSIEYIKIDIEGADMMALKSLVGINQRPRFISLESEKISWPGLMEEFRVLTELGYSKFKIIDQSKISSQQCPYPSKEGEYIDYKFTTGSSGLFGDELPGEWLSLNDAIKAYKKIFVGYKYFGDYGIFNNKLFMKNRYLKKAMRMFNLSFPHVGWYDTHATF